MVLEHLQIYAVISPSAMRWREKESELVKGDGVEPAENALMTLQISGFSLSYKLMRKTFSSLDIFEQNCGLEQCAQFQVFLSTNSL